MYPSISLNEYARQRQEQLRREAELYRLAKVARRGQTRPASADTAQGPRWRLGHALHLRTAR